MTKLRRLGAFAIAVLLYIGPAASQDPPMQLQGRRVLLTGDSHMEGAFGAALERKLLDQGAIVTKLAVGGSSARAWASGTACRPGTESCLTVEELIAAGPYDVVIMSLGTNDAANANRAGADLEDAAARAASNVWTFAERLGAPATFVVGPPTMADRGYYTNEAMAPVANALAQAFPRQPIRFIDSRSVPRLDGDGIHMGRRSSEPWTELVMSHVLEADTPMRSMNLARLLWALTPFGSFLRGDLP